MRSPTPNQGRAWVAFVLTERGAMLGAVVRRDAREAELRAAYLASLAGHLRREPCVATIATQAVGRLGSSSGPNPARLPLQSAGAWVRAKREANP